MFYLRNQYRASIFRPEKKEKGARLKKSSPFLQESGRKREKKREALDITSLLKNEKRTADKFTSFRSCNQASTS